MADIIEVALTKGAIALIDAVDLPLVEPYHWQLDTHGYAKRDGREDGKRFKVYMHRAILAAPPGSEVDHINRNKLDNRRSNLRFATRTQNNANLGLRSDNKSGFRGVSWAANHEKWQVHIRIGGRSRALGYFYDPAAGARAYDKAARDVFGEFAFLNFPEGAA